ncbi:MAG: PAS domain-containing protein [Magnetococcales bacterium]|nr:PAS domain-containing protein [Magnetococcales bacterium]
MKPFFQPFRLWYLVLVLVVVATITFLTAQGLRGAAAVGSGDYGVAFLILLYVNLFLALALGFLVLRHIFRLWLDRRQRRTGSMLRTRMALMFVALSLLPTLIIAILSVNFLNRGVDSWFSDRISRAMDTALDVSRSYYRESQRNVRHDAEGIVRNRAVASSLTLDDDEALSAVLEVERTARGLDEVAILRPDGTRIARAGELPFDPLPDLDALMEGASKALVVTSDAGDRVRAFVPLDDNYVLSTGHWIDRQILGQLETTEAVYVDYRNLRASHGLLKANHTVTLALIALLLILAAIWSGFRLADDLTDPIAELIVGARKVAIGDLTVTLSVTGNDELATLMAAFNAMTRKLQENHDELQATNALLEERRHFMAAIVQHISAGVISVNRGGEITLMNPAAGMLLGIDSQQAIGHHYRALLPESMLTPLAQSNSRRASQTNPNGSEENATQFQMQIQGADRTRTLMARVTPLDDGAGVSHGFIATFDDISDILLAQRSRAWSEVARRIAHEIKNPLTPIQLWAQRLRRKYMKHQTDTCPDWQVLDDGTNAIINQVEELRVLVNEFSTFARLPRPELTPNDLHTGIREVLLLHRAELEKITVTTEFTPDLPLFSHDRGQIKQVFTNLVSNAMAAIRERNESSFLAISTEVTDNGDWVRIQIADSGSGIPPGDRDRIFEPYFTTKATGVGLGMAIVKKIIEDHGGTIRIRQSQWNGALIEIRLPIQGVATPAPVLSHAADQEHIPLP